MKTLRKEAYREIFLEEMRDEFRPVIRAQVELAKGIAIIDRKDDTGERIFDRPPHDVGMKLIEQMIGKPKQDAEVEHKGTIKLSWDDAE